MSYLRPTVEEAMGKSKALKENESEADSSELKAHQDKIHNALTSFSGKPTKFNFHQAAHSLHSALRHLYSEHGESSGGMGKNAVEDGIKLHSKLKAFHSDSAMGEK